MSQKTGLLTPSKPVWFCLKTSSLHGHISTTESTRELFTPSKDLASVQVRNKKFLVLFFLWVMS